MLDRIVVCVYDLSRAEGGDPGVSMGVGVVAVVVAVGDEDLVEEDGVE
ncbi:hypothetical protein [Corynebacterium cystitidis]|nr:hypothetical protein [Corynebacterium cystitidis]